MLQSRGNRDNTLRFLALCGAAAPVIFAVLVTVGGLVYEGYSHATQAISELGGVEAQYPVIQNANFLVVGILITAFALGLHRGIRDGKGSKLGPVLLGLFGVITVAQALLPCGPGCEFESLTGALHNLTGLGSFVAAVIGILAISRRSKSDPRWHSYRGYSVITSAVALVALLAWIGIAKVAEIGSLNGVLQRIFVGLVLLWVEVMALRLFWLSRRSPVDMQRESIPGQCPGLTRAESSGQVSILPDDDNNPVTVAATTVNKARNDIVHSNIPRRCPESILFGDGKEHEIIGNSIKSIVPFKNLAMDTARNTDLVLRYLVQQSLHGAGE